MNLNKGFDDNSIQEYRQRLKSLGASYIIDEEDESTDEYAHFYFVGTFEGKDVIYDAVIYTLRLQHESEMYEIAEERAAEQFPDFKKMSFDESETDENVDPAQEEIGMFMAEVIMELEEEGTVKVKEHVDVDPEAEFGVGLDVGLNREKITAHVIERFIKEFNNNTLALDDTLYTFETQDEEG